MWRDYIVPPPGFSPLSSPGTPQPSGGGVLLLAPILARRGAELGAEHAAEVRGAVEAVVEGDGGHGTAALRGRQQRTRAGLQTPAQDVARHGLVLVTEQ